MVLLRPAPALKATPDFAVAFPCSSPARDGAGTPGFFASLETTAAEDFGGFCQGEPSMNRRDQELLEKQLHTTYVAPRNEGVLILAILAVFFAGMAFGGFLFAYTAQPGPMRVASNYAAQIAQR